MVYRGGVVALREVDLCLPAGKISILVGPSGAGKTTVLRSLNGTVRPAAGQVLIEGQDIAALDPAELRDVRRRIALIPQQFNLIKRETVLTSVLAGRLGSVSLLPALLGVFSAEDREIALRHIGRVGLQDKVHRRVDTLSGGEQQRVAVARALTQQPELILADEPVASLDQELARATMELFRMINAQDGITMLIALHDLRLVERYADRVIALEGGRVVYTGAFDGLAGAAGAAARAAVRA